MHSRDVKRERCNVYVDGEPKKFSLREDSLSLQADISDDEDFVDMPSAAFAATTTNGRGTSKACQRQG